MPFSMNDSASSILQTVTLLCQRHHIGALEPFLEACRAFAAETTLSVATSYLRSNTAIVAAARPAGLQSGPICIFCRYLTLLFSSNRRRVGVLRRHSKPHERKTSVMDQVLAVGVAGFVGTLARYWLSGAIDRMVGERFPAGTLAVNLLGWFLIGFLFHALTERYLVPTGIRSAVLVGLLGGFTTFSSYGIQTFALFRDGEVWLAGWNIVASNVGGIVLVWAGYTVSEMM